MKTTIIFNPTAKGERARRLFNLLRKLEGHIDILATSYPGHAIELARKAVMGGCQRLVAAGGDGTVSEVVAGAWQQGPSSHDLCIGIIPIGTMNVFATELGIPRDPEQAWQVIQQGRAKLIDLPILEGQGFEGRPLHRPFIQLAGCGLDSLAIEKVNLKLKKFVGPIAYAIATFSVLLKSLPTVHVRIDGKEQNGKLLLLGNGRFYAGSAVLFPKACLSDGLIDVRLFRRVDLQSLILFAKAWFSGGCVPLRKDHFYTQTRTVDISSPVRIPIEVDGDNVALLPARVRVIHQAIQVLVPE